MPNQRNNEIKKQLSNLYDLLSRYENMQIIETDPKREMKNKYEIAKIKEQIEEREQELSDVEALFKKEEDENNKPTIYTLSGKEKKEFRNALNSAFPTEMDLNQMTEIVLDKRLNQLVSNGSIEHQIFELIGTVISQGKLELFMRGALAENTDNFFLSEFLKKYDIIAEQ